MGKHDIENKEDVVLLVNTFYDNVKQSKIIGHIFSEIINVNWEEHLPKMYSFWSTILLGDQSYSGNTMQVHLALSKLTKLTEVEFNEWLSIFNNTVNKLFIGEKAEEAKLRAANIAKLMLHKIVAS